MLSRNTSTAWKHATAHEQNSEWHEHDEEKAIVGWPECRCDGPALTHDQRYVLGPCQAQVLCGVCCRVCEVHEPRRALPRAADVCPPPHDVDLSVIQSWGSGAVFAEQLVRELLALGTRDVVLSARREGGDVGRPGDAVNAQRHARFVVEVQDVVLLALPRALRYVL